MQRVLLLDYDGVLAENLRVNDKAIARVKQLSDQGFKIAIITGRNPKTTGELRKALEKHGLAEKIKLYCEHGAIELKYSNGKWKMKLAGKIRNYVKEEKKGLKRTIEASIKKAGFSKAVYENNVSFYISGQKIGCDVKGTVQFARKIVEKANSSGAIKTRLVVVPSLKGAEIIPANATKDKAAKRFIQRVGECTGFAVGDMFMDRKMAVGTKIKFIPVKNPEEFLLHSGKASQELVRRKQRLAKLKKERMQKRKKKPVSRKRRA